MTLQIITNNTEESEKALLDVEKQEIILKGDYYHNKIDERIEGFLAGLKYIGYEYELVNPVNAFPDEDVFELCEFYDATDD